MPKVFGSQPSVRSAGTTYEACRRSLAIRFTESRFRNEATGPVLLDMGLQRLLKTRCFHGLWSQPVTWEVVGVLSSVFVRVRLSLSSYVSVFVCLRRHISPSSSVSVIVPRWYVR